MKRNNETIANEHQNPQVEYETVTDDNAISIIEEQATAAIKKLKNIKIPNEDKMNVQNFRRRSFRWEK